MHIIQRCIINCLSVRFLETSTCTPSTILLRLAPTRIGNQEISVIRQQRRPQLILRLLVDILGIVRNDALRDGRSDGVYLRGHTPALDSNANVEVGKLILAEDEHRLEGLQPETFRFDILDRLSVDLDETAALLGECRSGGGLFPWVV